MSRIILSKYPNGQERVVVGWDHPARGAFWQEFSLEPPPNPITHVIEWPDEWEEMIRYGGYMPGIPLDCFRESVPDDLRELITLDVMEILLRHSQDPDSGYNRESVDLVSNT